MAQPKPIGLDFFQYNWREHSWSLVFSLGAVPGGLLAGIVFAHPEPVARSVAALTMFAYWNVPIAGGFLPPVLFDLTWAGVIVMFLGAFWWALVPVTPVVAPRAMPLRGYATNPVIARCGGHFCGRLILGAFHYAPSVFVVLVKRHAFPA